MAYDVFHHPLLAQTFKMPRLDIYLTVNEVKGRGRFRDAWLTWSPTPTQQINQLRQVDCMTKKYVILSEGGVPSSQALRTLWLTDESGAVRYICSK
jgi:hypothetical protein